MEKMDFMPPSSNLVFKRDTHMAILTGLPESNVLCAASRTEHRIRSKLFHTIFSVGKLSVKVPYTTCP